MFNIETILDTLSKQRPLFKSERDLQESLIQKLRSTDLKCEVNKVVNGTKVDLWIDNGEKEILIQLKHKTKKLSVNVGGSQFDLKNHGAQDQGRYDFLKDLKGLEQLCMDNPVQTGYAILLTNDHRYWDRPIKLDSVDKDFHLYEGRRVNGTLAWKDGTSSGTLSGREFPIELRGTYSLKWVNYSRFSSNDSEFRYLSVEVQ